jgi:hypothetical protein
MEETGHKNFNELLIKLKEYLNTRMELGKLTMIEKGVYLAASLISNSLVLLFLSLSFLLANLGLGFYLSEVFGNSYSGFLLLAIFYFLITLFVFFTKERILERKIMNGIIKKIFKTDHE